MNNFLKRHSAPVLAVGLGLAIVGGGAAAASAASSAARPTVDLTASTSTAAPSAGKADGTARLGRIERLARRAVHGDITVKTKNGYQVVTFDRGTVTSANGTSITLHRPDGPSVTVTLTPTTRYFGITGNSAIRTGQPAIVVSHDGSALAVAQRKAAASGASGTSDSSGTSATSS